MEAVLRDALGDAVAADLTAELRAVSVTAALAAGAAHLYASADAESAGAPAPDACACNAHHVQMLQEWGDEPTPLNPPFPDDVAIMGGAALAAYLRYHGAPSFQLGDVDVWVRVPRTYMRATPPSCHAFSKKATFAGLYAMFVRHGWAMEYVDADDPQVGPYVAQDFSCAILSIVNFCKDGRKVQVLSVDAALVDVAARFDLTCCAAVSRVDAHGRWVTSALFGAETLARRMRVLRPMPANLSAAEDEAVRRLRGARITKYEGRGFVLEYAATLAAADAALAASLRRLGLS